MPNTFFKFKEFIIHQERCAMKIGTDAVLLGAWANWSNLQDNLNILDIGTGTGILALMLAQKFPNATIKAIDIDNSATQQANENFKNSKFSHQIQAINIALQDFLSENIQNYFDIVICNPPYFYTHYPPNHYQRRIARHAETLNYTQLAEAVQYLLRQDGVFFIVIPYQDLNHFETILHTNRLFVNQSLKIYPNPSKACKRILLQVSKNQQTQVHKSITIETNIRHHYTEAYINLTKDFYLNF